MKYRKLIAKGLVFGIFFTNISTYSFANNINLKENKYVKEISTIETKADLQKSSNQIIKEDTWITGLASMPTPREGLTSVVVDDKIYCIGGYDGSSTLNKVEVYDPATDTWETKTPMPTARAYLTSVVLDGKIYVIGGDTNTSDNIVNKVEVYDPKTDTWETKTPMPTRRSALLSVVVDGKIYCIGGWHHVSYNMVEVYDPKTDTWETKTPMPTKRDSLIGAVIDEKIYCIGGTYDDGSYTYYNMVEVYDPKTDTWETKTSMPTKRASLASVVVDGKIYAIGGDSDSSTSVNTVEVYDSKTDTWETKTPMPTVREYLTSAVVDGRIYVFGGFNGSYLNTVEAYIIKLSQEDEARNAVINAETSREPIDIEIARDLVNKLEKSIFKDELQDRLNAIIPNLVLDIKNATANIDVYIKSENMLLMSLSTNSITFEDFSGVEEIEKSNALTVNINSSLAYDLNAYLVSEIQNADGSNKIDIDRLNIKANDENAYQEFTGVNQKLTLKSNCSAGNDLTHNIDLKLKGDDAYPADIYKTVIKFEAEQK